MTENAYPLGEKKDWSYTLHRDLIIFLISWYARDKLSKVFIGLTWVSQGKESFTRNLKEEKGNYCKNINWYGLISAIARFEGFKPKNFRFSLEWKNNYKKWKLSLEQLPKIN